MNDLKAEFLAYLRSVYANQPMPMSASSLPPLQVGPNYPAFKTSSLNAGLGMMAGMGQMGSPMMGGMQQPMMGGMQGGMMQQPALGGMTQPGLPPSLGMLGR